MIGLFVVTGGQAHRPLDFANVPIADQVTQKRAEIFIDEGRHPNRPWMTEDELLVGRTRGQYHTRSAKGFKERQFSSPCLELLRSRFRLPGKGNILVRPEICSPADGHLIANRQTTKTAPRTIGQQHAVSGRTLQLQATTGLDPYRLAVLEPR